MFCTSAVGALLMAERAREERRQDKFMRYCKQLNADGYSVVTRRYWSKGDNAAKGNKTLLQVRQMT